VAAPVAPPADAAPAARSSGTVGPLPAPPTASLAWTARIVAMAAVRAAPDAAARPTGRIAPVAQWNGGVVRLLVLDSSSDGEHAWLRVALPDRPNGSSGWIDADVAQLGRTRWRVVVDLAHRRGSAFYAGRRVRSWPVVIGTRATPTPRGLFAVYERVRQPAGSELGPYALHITAHSSVLEDFGGGAGRVALHGRDGPLLQDPLPSASSHGCVRMDDAVISWLAARAGEGTPVLIR
jgi:hypothetical protein